MIEALRNDKRQLPSRTIERIPLAQALAGDLDGAHRALNTMKRKVEASYLAVRYLRFIEGFEDEFPLSRA